MIKVYTIISSESEVPVAQLRTDNRVIDWIVDNTKGALPNSVGKDFQKLKQMIDSSSYLSLQEPSEPAAHLLTYLLNNGDTVEITTDGKTAILNGKLLQEEEKQSLFAAIKGGHVKVQQKADINSPTPIMPSMHESPVKPTEPQSPAVSSELAASMGKYHQKQKRAESMASSDYDHKIENESQYTGMADDDKAFTKSLLYELKYGGKNGR